MISSERTKGADMTRIQVFRLTVRPCTIRPDRFRWTIMHGEHAVRLSPESFASEAAAIAEGMTLIRELERQEALTDPSQR